ncbi:MAG TPA: PilZ domain-containing protein [Candidatus Saccharicenans sp.]|nr:PilZ domain-containing protein [Candidatus Saccharicenans sp.]HQO75854.1 PilZ domain-containing protein [Candidatus Saccharicenans sp.]HUM79725.1 PilZ domain-containing protein [Candidatus Saccharicenans sp.]
MSAEIYPSEKRISQRFKIPGATVSYRKESWLFKRKSFDEEFLPLEDLSRGGLRFVSQKRLKAGDKLFIQLSIPGERSPLGLLGKVRWSARSKTGNYPYEAGVQFNVYGEKKSQNYPGNLVKIISLEQKFAGQEVDLTTPPDEYDIESS